MHLIKPHTKINFLGQRYYVFAISITLLLVSLVSLGVRGLALDVDFTGGVVVEVVYPQAAQLGNVRQALADGGYKDATVQYFGTSKDVMIRLGPQQTKDTSEVSHHILAALQNTSPDVQLKRIEFVGSEVGSSLASKGVLALLLTIIGIFIYVFVRYHWKMATGAIVGLLHDVIITAGMFALFQWKFDLTVLAALLAILGYTINDTIVIFDRQRENFRRMRKTDTFTVMNVSINETLARTVMTTLTVVIVLVVLLFVGGSSVHEFALAMLIGVIVGALSTVYVASAVALHLKVTKEDIYPPKDEGGVKFGVGDW